MMMMTRPWAFFLAILGIASLFPTGTMTSEVCKSKVDITRDFCEDGLGQIRSPCIEIYPDGCIFAGSTSPKTTPAPTLKDIHLTSFPTLLPAQSKVTPKVKCMAPKCPEITNVWQYVAVSVICFDFVGFFIALTYVLKASACLSKELHDWCPCQKKKVKKVKRRSKKNTVIQIETESESEPNATKVKKTKKKLLKSKKKSKKTVEK